MKIRAILFDLDGVLVDATEWHYQALNRSLGSVGYTITRDEHVSKYDGLPTRKKLEILTREKGLPRGLHGAINRLKQEYTRQEVLAHCVPHFEKTLTIRELKRRGFRIAVCSNSIRETCELMLKASGVREQIDLVVSNEDVSRPKPDPEMYLKAMQHFNLHSREVIIVEDSGHGVEAAFRSGGNVCEVRGFADVNLELITQFVAQSESDESYPLDESA